MFLSPAIQVSRSLQMPVEFIMTVRPNEQQARLNVTKVPHFKFFSGEVKQISINLLRFQ